MILLVLQHFLVFFFFSKSSDECWRYEIVRAKNCVWLINGDTRTAGNVIKLLLLSNTFLDLFCVVFVPVVYFTLHLFLSLFLFFENNNEIVLMKLFMKFISWMFSPLTTVMINVIFVVAGFFFPLQLMCCVFSVRLSISPTYYSVSLSLYVQCIWYHAHTWYWQMDFSSSLPLSLAVWTSPHHLFYVVVYYNRLIQICSVLFKKWICLCVRACFTLCHPVSPTPTHRITSVWPHTGWDPWPRVALWPLTWEMCSWVTDRIKLINTFGCLFFNPVVPVSSFGWRCGFVQNCIWMQLQQGTQSNYHDL